MKDETLQQVVDDEELETSEETEETAEETTEITEETTEETTDDGSEELKAVTEERDGLKESNDELQKKIDSLQLGDVVRIAGNLGIMPELIGEKDAKGFDDLANASRQVKALKKMVRRDDESFKIGGKDYTKAEVYDLLDDWEEEESNLKRQFGSKMESVQKETMAIFRLGAAARAAQWVPGKKTAGDDKSSSARGTQKKGNKKPTRKSAAPVNKNGKRDFSKATDTNSLAQVIERDFE